MLKTNKATTIKGFSVIEGKNAAGFQAVINSDNPEDMTITNWQMDKALYKANREQCRADQAAFEDAAYALQNEMIAEMTAATE